LQIHSRLQRGNTSGLRDEEMEEIEGNLVVDTDGDAYQDAHVDIDENIDERGGLHVGIVYSIRDRMFIVSLWS
jgi:hypothetical protein